jgi:hypothetical protein
MPCQIDHFRVSSSAGVTRWSLLRLAEPRSVPFVETERFSGMGNALLPFP